MPLRKLFLSRWSALLWACGILWTAVDVAGVAPVNEVATDTGTNVTDATDATGMAVDKDDLATLANAMKGD